MRRLWHYKSVGCAAAVSFGNSQRPALCAGRMHSFSKEACSNSFDVDSNDASVCSLRALLPQAHVSGGRCRKLTPLRFRIFVSHTVWSRVIRCTSLQKIFGSGGGLRSVFFTRGLRGGNIREPLLKRTNGGRSCWKLPLYPPADRRGLAVLAEATTGCRPGEISCFGAA